MKKISIDTFKDIDGQREVHTIQISDRIFADVMINKKTGLSYVMQQENGSIGYDNEGNCYSLDDEEKILQFALNN